MPQTKEIPLTARLDGSHPELVRLNAEFERSMECSELFGHHIYGPVLSGFVKNVKDMLSTGDLTSFAWELRVYAMWFNKYAEVHEKTIGNPIARMQLPPEELLRRSVPSSSFQQVPPYSG
jgi:hypothetical protein